MKVVQQYPDGVFNWVDLQTTDIDGAEAFYGSLFGWEVDRRPVGDSGIVYTTFRIGGKSVAGGGQMSEGMIAAGMPTAWNSMVKFDDIEGVTERVAAAGGTVLAPPMDVVEEGRMAMYADPSGAVFGVWSPRNNIGAQLVNQPNTLVWNELQTKDTAATGAFYREVFGWTDAVDGNGYVTYYQDGRLHCGSLGMDESWGEMPSHWSVYFLVEDVADTVARAEALGATVLVPPSPAGELGTMAVLRDPQGGAFSVIRFNGPADEPPGP